MEPQIQYCTTADGVSIASDTVRSLARTSAGVESVGHGQQALKGVGEPVRVWSEQE